MYCMQNQAESPASVLAVWGGCTVLGGDYGHENEVSKGLRG